MSFLRNKFTSALVVAVAAIGAASASASASDTFAHHIQLNVSDHFEGPLYYGSVIAMTVQSYGVAYSGTWVNDSSGYGGSLTSTKKYCATPGCQAQEGFLGPTYPSGYPTAENHGNASTSYFEGVVN